MQPVPARSPARLVSPMSWSPVDVELRSCRLWDNLRDPEFYGIPILDSDQKHPYFGTLTKNFKNLGFLF